MKRYCYICRETIDNDQATVCPVCGCENSLCASKDEEELLRIGYKTNDLKRMKQLKKENPDAYTTQIKIQKYKIKKYELAQVGDLWSFLEKEEKKKRSEQNSKQYLKKQKQKNSITPPQPEQPQPTTPQKYVVHCPYCQSPHVHKIGFSERATSVFMLGPFSKKINKSYQCKNCRATW